MHKRKADLRGRKHVGFVLDITYETYKAEPREACSQSLMKPEHLHNPTPQSQGTLSLAFTWRGGNMRQVIEKKYMSTYLVVEDNRGGPGGRGREEVLFKGRERKNSYSAG